MGDTTALSVGMGFGLTGIVASVGCIWTTKKEATPSSFVPLAFFAIVVIWMWLAINDLDGTAKAAISAWLLVGFIFLYPVVCGGYKLYEMNKTLCRQVDDDVATDATVPAQALGNGLVVQENTTEPDPTTQ